MNRNDRGVAVDGYDVVTYCTEDHAVRGSSEFTVEHDRFVLQEVG